MFGERWLCLLPPGREWQWTEDRVGVRERRGQARISPPKAKFSFMGIMCVEFLGGRLSDLCFLHPSSWPFVEPLIWMQETLQGLGEEREGGQIT